MADNVQSYSSDVLNTSQVIFHPLDHVDGAHIPTALNATSAASTTTTTFASTIILRTPEPPTESNHVLAYVLVPLGSLAFIALLSFVVIFILRKSRMDRLRHHLMPLYNFDPMEEEGDWESELLEEEKEQQVALNIRSPSPRGPKLKFHTDL